MNEKIGKPIKRVDAAEKIGGQVKYLADIEFEGMLYARTLRSTRARAKIISIDISELPEGYYIVDRSDVPGRNRVKIIFYDMPFFAEDEVNYIGEPILLVVGPDREEILSILSNIKVVYEDMEPILSMADALANTRAPIFGDNNLYAEYAFSKGNLEEVAKGDIKKFEGEYSTGYQEHIYLETQGVVAECIDDKIRIWGSMQCPYFVKDAVVEALGFDKNKVQVIQTTTGGGFGGKEEYPSLLAGQVAVAALKIKKPVRLILDRAEDIEVSTKRHPSSIKIKSYIGFDKKILGMDVDIKIDGGAYSGLSNIVLQRTMFAAIGVYNVENVKINGVALATNKVVGGGFRGFGAPQAFFALEMHMDYISKELGINALEFRKLNILKKGDISSTGGVIRENTMLPEIIEVIENMSNYKGKVAMPKKKGILKGIGCSLFFHGCGFTGSGEKDIIKAKVKLLKHRDRTVEILVSNVEMGQGAQTTLKKIVAYTLEIPINRVIFKNPDTDKVPDSGPTVASRTITIVGKLLQDAAIDMKEFMGSDIELEILKNYKHPEGFKWDDETFKGDAYNTYAWGANVIEVEVNPITYEVSVTDIYAVFDIGEAIDELIVRGQIEGGMVQGLGYAGMEVMRHKDGRLLQRTNTDYVIPTAMDFPKIQSELVNNPYINGPFGAKGVGETTLIGAAAAYALAVQNAIGHNINKIPVTPEYLMEVMKNKN
ncbi:xanthine dehydrogenase family protein molybdopterin-binding subunit [Clostridium algoriphilum]|uniref:xanthine dehydrogenase family protein molybdopterin-binding subunit n=1 Tax=Clostridium algoriphilum TaxID=198347 RepID=UPI001CF0E64F|nr:xanthine dehydrogenase family protein molybdopterin-binding subunit [Clostridium algoriphilum]MCB2293281.1 xanthine dehydrogenase family protein molybdopterin-binding subunit [Clostridium algoriphilum]